MTTDLLSWRPPEPPQFGGNTFDRHRDGERLNAQCQRVYDAMHDGEWRLLSEISAATGDPEASISARLRDLRKPAFGTHQVERQYVRAGLWRYRLGPPRAATLKAKVETKAKATSRPRYADPGAP